MYVITHLTFWNSLRDVVNPIPVPSSAKLLYLITCLELPFLRHWFVVFVWPFAWGIEIQILEIPV